MAQHLLFVLAQIAHVQLAVLLGPVLMGLDGQRRTSRKQFSPLGKMRTTWVRRLISSFKRSGMLVDLRCL
jgi:hypothetical protein